MEPLTTRLGHLDEAFLPASPVHSTELLAGRGDQLIALLEVQRSRGSHAAIYGERGVGKTSVAAVWESNIRALGGHVVRLNCSEIDSFTSIWCNVAQSFMVTYPDGQMASAMSSLMSEGVSQASVVRALQTLEGKSGCVVILDEFDTVGDDSVGRDTASLMKAISDAGLNSHVAVVGVAEDVDSILRGHASVSRGLVQVRMPRLSSVELNAILEKGFALVGLSSDPEPMQKTINFSQGLPHYAHLLGKELARASLMRESSRVLETDWPTALHGALRKSDQQVIEQHRIATTTAKPSMFADLLVASAQAPKDEQGFFRPADVGPHLERLLGKRLAMASYTGNLASLSRIERGSILEVRTFADGRKRYRFANPLMQPYVVGRAIEAGRIADVDSVWNF